MNSTISDYKQTIQKDISEIETAFKTLQKGGKLGPRWIFWVGKERSAVNSLTQSVKNLETHLNEFAKKTDELKDASDIFKSVAEVHLQLSEFSSTQNENKLSKLFWKVISILGFAFGSLTPTLELKIGSLESKVQELSIEVFKAKKSQFSYAQFKTLSSVSTIEEDLKSFKSPEELSKFNGAWKIQYHGNIEGTWDVLKGLVGYTDAPYTLQTLTYNKDKKCIEHQDYAVKTDGLSLELHPIGFNAATLKLPSFPDFYMVYNPQMEIGTRIKEIKENDALNATALAALKNLSLDAKKEKIHEIVDQISQNLDFTAKPFVSTMKNYVKNKVSPCKTWNEVANTLNVLLLKIKDASKSYSYLLTTNNDKILKSLDKEVKEFIFKYEPLAEEIKKPS